MNWIFILKVVTVNIKFLTHAPTKFYNLTTLLHPFLYGVGGDMDQEAGRGDKGDRVNKVRLVSANNSPADLPLLTISIAFYPNLVTFYWHFQSSVFKLTILCRVENLTFCDYIDFYK